MKVKKLRDLLSGMPDNATVEICFDGAKEMVAEADEYEAANINVVHYDLDTNTVELREKW